MARGGRGRGRPISGWLPINKSVGMTSTQVVSAVKRITGAAKAGHGGTLDPFSEGLLPIALGEATKTIALILEGDKAYRCWLRFGSETDSGDPTGQVVAESQQVPTREALEGLLPRFTGAISQIPPAHSAIHVDGERAYERVRRGETVEIPPREVIIHQLALVSFSDTMAVLDVRCGKGTYMRSLARDIGRELGCLAHLERLQRTGTTGYSLEEAITLEELGVAVRDGRLEQVLHPVDRVLADIPALRLGTEAWLQVKQGQAVWVGDLPEGTDGPVRLYDPQGRFAALGDLGQGRDPQGRRQCRPRRLIHTT